MLFKSIKKSVDSRNLSILKILYFFPLSKDTHNQSKTKPHGSAGNTMSNICACRDTLDYALWKSSGLVERHVFHFNVSYVQTIFCVGIYRKLTLQYNIANNYSNQENACHVSYLFLWGNCFLYADFAFY